MPTITLPEAALGLVRRRHSGERVEVADETRRIDRERVDAGMMIPLHTVALGPENACRLSEAACDVRDGVNAPSSISPSA